MSGMLSKLTIEPRGAANEKDPFTTAKARLLANLDKQLLSAQAMADGKPYPDVRRKWYFRDADNKVRIRLRVGASVMDLGGGNTDIVVGVEKELPKAIEMVVAAVQAGELDEHIKNALAQRKPRSKRK